MNAVDFDNKKVLIWPEQDGSTKGKKVVIGESRPKRIVPKRPEVGVWKKNRTDFELLSSTKAKGVF